MRSANYDAGLHVGQPPPPERDGVFGGELEAGSREELQRRTAELKTLFRSLDPSIAEE